MRSPALIRQWVATLLALILIGPGLWFTYPNRAWGAFQFLSSEARPAGMGDAFSAVADDSSAAVFNPAGLAHLSHSSLSTQFTNVVQGLNEDASVRTGSAGFYSPLRGGRWGTAGLSFSSYHASRLAREEVVSASYARSFSFEGFDGLSWGINLKGLRRGYEANPYSSRGVTNGGVVSGTPDPVFQSGDDKTAMGVDVGALARFGAEGRFQAGISASNINHPSIGLKDKADKADSIWRGGLAYKRNETLLATEYRQASRLTRKDQEGAIGLERHIPLSRGFGAAFRGGYQKGSRRFEAWSLGFSLLTGLVRFDYGYQFRTGLLSDIGGGHRVGVVFTFPIKAATASPVKLAKARANSPAKDPSRLWREKLADASHLNSQERALFFFLTREKYSKGEPPEGNWPELRDPVIEKIEVPNYGFAYAAVEYWRLGQEPIAKMFLTNLKGPEKDTGFLAALYALCLWDAMEKTDSSARPEFKRNERRALNAHFETSGEVYLLLAELLSEPTYTKKEPSDNGKKSS